MDESRVLDNGISLERHSEEEPQRRHGMVRKRGGSKNRPGVLKAFLAKFSKNTRSKASKRGAGYHSHYESRHKPKHDASLGH
jgi:hypothetical protein